MKKSIKACALGVAVIVGGLFTSCNGSNNHFDDVDLIPVTLKEDGNWSMVNAKGEIVYDGEFKEEPSMCYNGVFSVKEGNGYTLYRQGSKGPEVVGEAEKLEAVGYLNDGLIPVTFPNKRISVLDKDGKQKFELAPINGFEVVSCAPGYEDGMLTIKMEDDKYGYLDKDGNNVIKPNYKEAYNFTDGLAVVAKESGDSDDSNTEYIVINKKGETEFKIKDGFTLENHEFEYGYIYAKNDDRCILIDEKGEITKFPAKITKIATYNDKYVIFEGEDGLFGVADMKGEILIRAKYEMISFDEGDNFLACKDFKDKEILRINKDGEEVAKFDFEFMLNVGKFGYLAKDGKTTSLVDKEGKAICKDDFYEVGLNLHASHGDIESDYFNPEAIAATLVGMITDKGVGNVTIGESASQLLSGKEPSKYSYSNNVELEDLNKNGFRYEIKVQASFEESIANFDYNPATYSGSYKWNPLAKVSYINLGLETDNEWGREGFDKLLDALKSKGYKEYKTGEVGNSYTSIFKKGTIWVLVQCDKNSDEALVSVGAWQQSVIDEAASEIKKISSASSKSASVDEDEVVEVEEVATDSDYKVPTGGSLSQFAFLSNRKLTPDELVNYTSAELRILRNAIFARHGYIFQSDDLNSYFSKFPDYNPVTRKVSGLNSNETANIELLKRYE